MADVAVITEQAFELPQRPNAADTATAVASQRPGQALQTTVL